MHWFQFADDAAVITCLENENLILLNHFTQWCNWAGMIIKVNKCLTFDIKKAGTSSIQYFPNVILNFFFGSNCWKNFNFHTDTNKDHMSLLLDTSKDLMLKIYCLPCHPKSKFLLYLRFVLSTLSRHLTIIDLSKK